MPICKNCHSRIDKFNKDRCPICGTEKPFEGVSSDTIEITTSLDVEDLDFNPRSKKKLLVLYITLGFFGIPQFYLYNKKLGVLSLILNMLFIGLGGFLLGQFTSIKMYLAFIIVILASLLINSLIGLYLYKKPNLKDGHGEFVI
ncbi:MAG: TM2 domain-containing protein [Bacilli bacterium]|nr:TM2 domain-containing protein [Bacilli bacterium]